MTYLVKMKGRKTPLVAVSLEEVRKVFLAAQDARMRQGGVIRSAEVTKDGEPVARVSQNGNVWPLDDWFPGQEPIVGVIATGPGLAEVTEYHSNM